MADDTTSFDIKEKLDILLKASFGVPSTSDKKEWADEFVEKFNKGVNGEDLFLDEIPGAPDFEGTEATVRTAEEAGLSAADFAIGETATTYSFDPSNKPLCSIVDDATGTVRRFRFLILERCAGIGTDDFSWLKKDSSGNILFDSLQFNFKMYEDVAGNVIKPYEYKVFTEDSIKAANQTIPSGSAGGNWIYDINSGILLFPDVGNLQSGEDMFKIGDTNKPVMTVYKYIGRKGISKQIIIKDTLPEVTASEKNQIVVQTSDDTIHRFNGTEWLPIGGGGITDASFKDVSLNYLYVHNDISANNINLQGDISGNDASFNDVSLNYLYVHNDISANNINLQGDISGHDASFNDVSLNYLYVHNDISANNINLQGDISGHDASFNDVSLNYLYVHNDISANNINLQGDISANDASFNDVSLNYLYVHNDISANNINLQGDISANNINLQGDISANNINLQGDISANDASFNDVSLNYLYVYNDISTNDIYASKQQNFTNITDISITEIVDVYSEEDQLSNYYGNYVEYEAGRDISNGEVCVTDISNNKIYAVPTDLNNILTGNARESVIGIALEKVSKGENVKILTDGYCSVRYDQKQFNISDETNTGGTVVLNSSTNDNTYSVDGSGVLFTDSGGTSGNYTNSENYKITFDAGEGNTIDLSVNDLFTEQGTTSLWDRLGFQVSTDGSNWVNADISGLIHTDDTQPENLLPPWPPTGTGTAYPSTTTTDQTRGWIFPEDIKGLIASRLHTFGGVDSSGGVFKSPTDDMKRYIRFFFRSDSDLAFTGWEIEVKSSSIQTHTIGPKNGILYLSNTDAGQTTLNTVSGIKVGYTVMDTSFNALGGFTFARINLKT